MKILHIAIIAIVFVSCKSETKKQGAEVDKILRTYLTKRLPDFKEIDSLYWTYIDQTAYTIAEGQRDEYRGAVGVWQYYASLSSDRLYELNLESAECTALRDLYAEKAVEVEKQIPSKDSTKFLYWRIHLKGIYTRTDNTLADFTHTLYVTPEYKIIEVKNVIEIASYPSGHDYEIDVREHDLEWWQIINRYKELGDADTTVAYQP